MEVTLRWLAGQKETPSFTTHLLDNVSSILDAPLPRSLQLDEPSSMRAVSPSASTLTRGRGSASPGASRRKHDELLAEGKLMLMRREALQEQALAAAQSLMQSKPSVSQVANAIPPRDEAIEARLLRKAREAEEKRVFEAEIRRIQKQKDVEAVASFRPSISVKGKRADSKVMTAEYYENWHRRREQRLEARRTENLLKEISDLRDGPDINLRSQKLAAAKREKEGLAGISHVEAMLERDRLTKLAAWERCQREAEAMANPQITVFAATLPREGTAAERLYATSFALEERRAQQKAKRDDDRASASFSPRISRLAAAIPRVAPVEDEILQRHHEARALQAERHRLEEEHERDAHHPAINPVSDAIASRLPVTAMERLVQPRGSHIDPSTASGAPGPAGSVERSKQRSVSSVTRSSSVHSAASAGITTERAEALAAFEERRQQNLERLKAEALEREMDGCTFAPRTNRSSHPPPTALAPRGSGTVAQRNHQWQVKRDMKLDEQRRRQEASALRECTFVPQRPHSHILEEVHNGDTASPLRDGERADVMDPKDGRDKSSGIYGGDGMPWGSREFVSRMNEARRLKEEKENRLRNWDRSGAAWSPKVTAPQEFHLGRQRTPVRSLQKPADAGAVGVLSNSYLGPPDSLHANEVELSHHAPILPPSMWHVR